MLFAPFPTETRDQEDEGGEAMLMENPEPSVAEGRGKLQHETMGGSLAVRISAHSVHRGRVPREDRDTVTP